MSRRDVFGPKLQELFMTTDEPLTVTAAAERVGCSMPRAYAWVQGNRDTLRAMGRGSGGAESYVAKANAHFRRRAARSDRRPAPFGTVNVEIGSKLEVVDVAIRAGRVVVTVADEQGAVQEFTSA